MRISRQGLRFLASWEGLRTVPYNDSANNATVGIGHLLHYGPVTPGDRRRWRGLTVRGAYRLLARDMRSYEHDVRAAIHRSMNQAQFDAFVDLVYNCGPAPLYGSVGRLFNEGRYGEAADAMLAWSHAGGQFSPGLYRRRVAERELFLRHTYHDN